MNTKKRRERQHTVGIYLNLEFPLSGRRLGAGAPRLEKALAIVPPVYKVLVGGFTRANRALEGLPEYSAPGTSFLRGFAQLQRRDHEPAHELKLLGPGSVVRCAFCGAVEDAEVGNVGQHASPGSHCCLGADEEIKCAFGRKRATLMEVTR